MATKRIVTLICDSCGNPIKDGQAKDVRLESEGHEWRLDFCPACYVKLHELLGLDIVKLTCLQCGYVAKSKAGLTRHKSSHAGH